jgi:hypothetical protein
MKPEPPALVSLHTIEPPLENGYLNGALQLKASPFKGGEEVRLANGRVFL